MIKNDKTLAKERKIGSMDSIDTFVSCFTHPFNSLVDLEEEQFKQDTKRNRNDLKDDKNKNLIKSQNKIGDIKTPVNQVNQIKKAEEQTKKLDKEFPLIVDINKNNEKEEFKMR